MKRPLNAVASAARTALAGLVAAGIGAVALTAGSPPAGAQQALRVTANKAAIVRLAGQAQNVIIGDPRVADITVENRSMLILFGRSPGETNLIVLDARNREILSVPVVVTTEKDRHVSVISAGKTGYAEVVYNCAERCIKMATTSGAAPAASGGCGQGPVPEAAAAAPSQPEPAAVQPQTPAAAEPAPSKKGYKR